MKADTALICLINIIFCVNSSIAYEVNDDSREIRLSDDSSYRLRPEVFSAMKRYQCCADCGENAELMMYGSRAWTFPMQDITLNFTYPSEKAEEINDRFADHVITGFQITIYQSGNICAGYHDSGGIGERHLKLSFVCQTTSSIAYQFWVYGMPINTFTVMDRLTEVISVC